MRRAARRRSDRDRGSDQHPKPIAAAEDAADAVAGARVWSAAESATGTTLPAAAAETAKRKASPLGGERRERSDLRDEDEHERSRAVGADRVLAHDLERALPRPCPERIGGVGDRVEVQGTGQRRAGRDGDGRGERPGQRSAQAVRDTADDRADSCPDEREVRPTPRDIGAVEREQPADWVRA